MKKSLSESLKSILIIKHTIFLLLGCIILIVTLVPLLLMNFYNHPSTNDDFYILQHLSLHPNLSETLLSILIKHARYNGFFTNFMLQGLKVSKTIEGIQRYIVFYRLFSIFVILLFFSSILHLFMVFNKYFFKKQKTLVFFIYTIFMFSIVNYINRFAFLFYDFVATNGYTVGLCLSILLLACIPSYYYENKKKTVVVSLSVLTCGFVEYYTIVIAYIVFIVICIKYYKQKKIDFIMFMLIAFCFIIALWYKSAPLAHEKAVLYSGITENLYTSKNFKIFLKSIIRFFIYALKDYISLNICIYNLILISFTVAFFSRKQIKIPILFYISFLGFIFLMSLTLFLSGIFHVDQKATSVMVFRFFTFIVYTLFFAQCILVLYNYIIKLYGKLDISNEVNSIKSKIIENAMAKNAICNILSFVFLFIFFVNFMLCPIPIRSICRELYKGYAKTYNTQVWQIYNDLLDSKEDKIEIYQPDYLIETSHIHGIWVKDIYENHHELLEPAEQFFDKTIIIKTK